MRSERGVFLVLFGVLVIAILIMCALMIGIGFVAGSKARLQNTSNLAALAGIEEYVQQDTASDAITRANAVKDRIEYIMRHNRLVGAPDDATAGLMSVDGSPGTGGQVTFGVWYPEALPGVDPCGGRPYPCFVAHPSPSSWTPPYPPVNAIRIETKTANPIVAPFAKIFGDAGFNIASSAIGAVVPRCTVFLLDASASTTNDSHPSRIRSFREINRPTPLPSRSEARVPWVHNTPAYEPDFGATATQLLYYPPKVYLLPRTLQLFAFNDWVSYYRNAPGWLGWGGEIDLRNNTGNPCSNRDFSAYISGLNAVQPVPYREGQLWCNMQWEHISDPISISALEFPANPARRRVRALAGGGFGDAANCYEYEGTPYGRMLIDKCTDPQPLTEFMLGFNAGIRLLESQKTAADRIRMSVFRGTADVNPIPPPGAPNAPKFTQDMSLLVQLTNANYRGKIQQPIDPAAYPDVTEPDDPTVPIAPPPIYSYEEVHPNFVDQGWFPFFMRGGEPANLAEAGTNIYRALEQAMNALGDTTQCPSSAQKSIVIATDGVSSCAPTGGTECSPNYSTYLDSERFLLQDEVGRDSMVTELKKRKIALTVLLAGNDVRPNLVNRTSAGGEYLDFAEEVALNYRGLTSLPPALRGDPTADPNIIVDARPLCGVNPEVVCMNGGNFDDEYAFLNAGVVDNVYFQRPNGVLAHMAIETGGIFCPLLPRADEDASLTAGITPDPGESMAEFAERCWYVDHDGDPSTPKRLRAQSACPDNTVLRTPGSRLSVSPYFLSAGETAAYCVRKTLGGNPFVLVQEE